MIENHGLNWNDFFQLVVFYSLAPSVGVITALFNSFPGTDKQFISWKDIIQFLSLLHTDNLISDKIKMIFMRLDVNLDGLLSLRQLFQFVQVTEELWLPIYTFRVKLISNFLPSYYNILTRKSNIGLIKQYQKQHKGKDPKQPCFEAFKNFILRRPNPTHHDYGCSPLDITLSHVVTTYIKKFNINYHNVNNDNFLRNIEPLSSNPVLLQIDMFYSNAPRSTNRRNGSSEVLFAEISARNRSNSNSSNSGKKSVRVMPYPVPRSSNKVSTPGSPSIKPIKKITMESEYTSTFYTTVHSNSDEHDGNVTLLLTTNVKANSNTNVVSALDSSTLEDDHSI